MNKPHSCFVIMPFSDTEHGPDNDKKKISEAQWSHIFEHWIKKAVESYKSAPIACKRSPAKPGNFVKGIVADLDSSDLVIADLTGAKPNVYYELGIRHALRVGTIIITQHFDSLPSDLRNYFVFEYVYSEKAHEYDEFFAKFEKEMHEKLQAWNDTDDPSDSPVSDFLGIINQRLEKECEQEKEELKNILFKLKAYFAHNFEVCEIFLNRMKGEENESSDLLQVIDVFAIDTIYSRLIGYNWKNIKGEGLESLEKVIVYHRRLFNEVATAWNALHANPQQPWLTSYLAGLLESLAKEKKHFNEKWDDGIGAIDTIKLVKQGKEGRN
jgi:hypothetical protein